uniref:Uncharacterized protein n=1 Tax=Rousettus aegyptiacus TaxID=9407 RepID=A0A7J8GBS0_ROUAE|nr:hypothetical protein HJG63_011796 [Rousettus aegyptiacus]
MTWEPQQRVDGGPDRPRGRCSAARVYSLALGLARLLGSTGRKRGPGDTPSTLRKARTPRATSHPCPRGLLWPQGRRHQPTWGRQWCPRPGEPPRSGGGKAGATAERSGGCALPVCPGQRSSSVRDPTLAVVGLPLSSLRATSGSHLA